MSLALFAPSRTVVLIADEALSIFSTGFRGVRLVETIPWDSEDFEQSVAATLSKDCGGKPVLILNDMVEQHYRKERVPNVGVLDKANVLQRKLNVTFPSYPVKAALPLKEKIPKTEKTAAASIYIFAAVPGTDAFNKTMAAVSRSLVPVVGFGMLPVESSDLVKALGAKLAKKNRTKSKWVVFMGQHRNGSLRQIVTKNGELALTRMTPVTDQTTNPDAWLTEIGQEFKATMSYLTRFGYAPDDGLDLIVITDSETGARLEENIEADCHFTSMTISDAAQMLGVALGHQEQQTYADALHVAWAGRKSKMLLPMKAKAIDSVSRPRQAALAASLLLFLGAAFQGYQVMDKYQAIALQKSDLEDARQSRAQLNVQYQKEVKRKEDLGFDIRLVQSSLAVYDELERKNIKPLEVLYGVGRALGRDLRLDQITVQKPQANLAPKLLAGGAATTPLYEAAMQMTFPSTTNIDKGNDEVRGLRDRLQTYLPDNTIQVTKFLKDYEYTENVVVETGEADKKNVSQDFVAEIFVRGPAL